LRGVYFLITTKTIDTFYQPKFKYPHISDLIEIYL